MAAGDLEKFDIEVLRESVNTWNKLNDLLTRGNSTIRLVSTKIEEKFKFKNKLEAYKYNPTCEVCIANNASVIEDIKAVNGELDELNAKKLIQEDSISKIIEEMEPLENDRKDFEEAQLLQGTIKTLEQQVYRADSTLGSAKVAREKIQMTITKLNEDIFVYKTNEENILFNQNIDALVGEIQQTITQNKKKVQEIDKKVRDVHGSLSVLRARKDELQGKLKEAEELETTYEAYNHYMLAVGRDGVPYELMSKTIPNIEAEINAILSQIVDFTVSLEVDGKNINGKLMYDNERIWPLENSSGMERFVSSLAIRVALMNASNLPKSNFLIIDEGFATLDAEHIHAMQTLFNILKTQVDFIFIVSHLDAMRDMVDHLIEIKREDGYSRISV
jgi:DNA repair exonuclease SbcCD ATPase subunit